MTRRLLAATAVLALLAACDALSGDPARTMANEAVPANAAASNAANAAAPLGEPLGREAALKLMHERHENMEAIGDAAKKVGRTLKTDSPDLDVIRASAAAIAERAPHVPSWFPPGTGPETGKTHAKAEIWRKPEDFAAKAHALDEAARAFQAAAQSGDLEAIKARFAELGKTCKACHDDYRAKLED